MLLKNENKRAEYIRKNKLFYSMGQNNYFHPWKIAHEGYLLNIHNNVYVAAFEQYIGSIEIFGYCFIRANSAIMYNIKIFPNVIVAAGSVVTKAVPEDAMVGGNPARIKGKFDTLMEKEENFHFQQRKWE